MNSEPPKVIKIEDLIKAKQSSRIEVSLRDDNSLNQHKKMDLENIGEFLVVIIIGAISLYLLYKIIRLIAKAYKKVDRYLDK